MKLLLVLCAVFLSAPSVVVVVVAAGHKELRFRELQQTTKNPKCSRNNGCVKVGLTTGNWYAP